MKLTHSGPVSDIFSLVSRTMIRAGGPFRKNVKVALKCMVDLSRIRKSVSETLLMYFPKFTYSVSSLRLKYKIVLKSRSKMNLSAT